MIVNLKDTTQKNHEQDWLKTNLAKFSCDDAGPEEPRDGVAQLIMSELTPLVAAHHGAFFMMDGEGNGPILKLIVDATRYRRAQERRQPLPAGRGPDRAVRAREEDASC